MPATAPARNRESPTAQGQEGSRAGDVTGEPPSAQPGTGTRQDSSLSKADPNAPSHRPTPRGRVLPDLRPIRSNQTGTQPHSVHAHESLEGHTHLEHPAPLCGDIPPQTSSIVPGKADLRSALSERRLWCAMDRTRGRRPYGRAVVACSYSSDSDSRLKPLPRSDRRTQDQMHLVINDALTSCLHQ